ncbi:hypothetical protein NXC24_PB00233 (plasmid) [Rhizobium sp. NXC24]|nr:hypothetical protein NXC24_PB00233 [Rhizobium sp. NXC24]
MIRCWIVFNFKSSLALLLVFANLRHPPIVRLYQFTATPCVRFVGPATKACPVGAYV